jgi:Leucine-rich repeat (LRR) protein
MAMSGEDVCGLHGGNVELWGEEYDIMNTHELKIWNQELNTTIPDNIGELVFLRELYLYNDGLTGSIPSSLTNMTYLKSLQLGENQLSGEIPSWIFQISPYLEELNLSNNNLSGQIPDTLGFMYNAEFINLTNNNLSGNIPESFCELSGIPNGSTVFGGNKLCPPYPECVHEIQLGEQDTSECECWDQGLITCPDGSCAATEGDCPFIGDSVLGGCQTDKDCGRNQICVGGMCRSKAIPGKLGPVNIPKPKRTKPTKDVKRLQVTTDVRKRVPLKKMQPGGNTRTQPVPSSMEDFKQKLIKEIKDLQN